MHTPLFRLSHLSVQYFSVWSLSKLLIIFAILPLCEISLAMRFCGRWNNFSIVLLSFMFYTLFFCLVFIARLVMMLCLTLKIPKAMATTTTITNWIFIYLTRKIAKKMWNNFIGNAWTQFLVFILRFFCSFSLYLCIQFEHFNTKTHTYTHMYTQTQTQT